MAPAPKKQRNAVLIFGTAICLILLIVMQINNRDSTAVMTIGAGTIPISSFNGVISGLLTVTCIIMVCFDPKKGTVISLCFLIYQIITLSFIILRSNNLTPLPGVLNMAVMSVLMLFLRRTLLRREKEMTTDYLTGLANRRGFMAYLDELDKDKAVNVLYIDLDDFKLINDNLGHREGNKVLKTVAKRISSSVSENAFVARLGGDEYVVILPAEEDPEKAAQKLLDSLSERIRLYTSGVENSCYVTASVGIASYPADSDDTDTLMKYADIAMYQAKKIGKNKYLRFDKKLESALLRQAELENIIKESLDNDYFYLVYQPQFFAESSRLRGFEALLRLKTPSGEFISPGEFIPAAEKTNLILRIDEYVIERAIKEFGEIIKKIGKDYLISINVSAKNISRGGFADMVINIAEQNDFPFECLCIEITEYCLALSMKTAVENISILKEKGIRIALDDFGTGYASLSYLTKLPIDLLKIDKSFIDEIGADKKSSDFVSAVISIGHITECSVLSEGVETNDQLSMLKDKGCDYIQGYVLGKPMSFEDASSLAQNAAGGSENKFS